MTPGDDYASLIAYIYLQRYVTFSIRFAVVVVALRWRRKNSLLPYVGAIAALSLLADGIRQFPSVFRALQEYPSNLYTLAEPVCWGAVFQPLLGGRFWRVSWWMACGVVAALVVVELRVFQPNQTFSYSISLVGVLLLVWSVQALLRLSTTHEGPLRGHWGFWLATGTLVYAAGSLFIYLFRNYSPSLPYLAKLLIGTVQWGLVGLQFVFVGVAAWKLRSATPSY